MRHIGFTGTRFGMTEPQEQCVLTLLGDLTRDLDSVGFDARGEIRDGRAHHGDCIGADADFHALARAVGLPIVGHLPVDESHRAFCSFDFVRAPLTHMARNRAIVAESDVMIACPFEETEQQRGGTWATVRMARKAGKPLAIVWRDGRVTYERWP